MKSKWKIFTIFLYLFCMPAFAGDFVGQLEPGENGEDSEACENNAPPASLADIQASIEQVNFLSWSCNDAKATWVSSYGSVFHYDTLGNPGSHGECRRRANQCGYTYYSSTTYAFGSWRIHGCIGFF